MYAIFFDKDNITYSLPVNPEQIEITSTQAIERYEILKSGQVAIPTHMELKEYSFEYELPHTVTHYTETSRGFKDADYYLRLFEQWRKNLEPVRFIACNGMGDDINSLVLIEDLRITEKAGEEGDKYVSFSLLEYVDLEKQIIPKPADQLLPGVIKEEPPKGGNPKHNGTYTVVRGDSLWAIAKKFYGDGSLYTKIVEANRDKIKNPSLIYPGQKLVIPE